MKILVVVPWYKPQIGGVVIAVERLSKGLMAAGHQVNILIPGHGERPLKVRDEDGIPVYQQDLRSPYNRRNRIRALAAFLLTIVPSLYKLRSCLQHQSISAVIVSYIEPSAICFPLGRWILNVPYYVWAHGSDIQLMPTEPRLVQIIKSVIVQRASGFVVASESMLRDARRLFPRLPKDSLVIPLGIDRAWGETSIDSQVDLPPRYILTLATALAVKGPDVAIRAFSLVADKFPDVSLVMVGSGPEEAALRGLIDQLNLNERIWRIGSVPNEQLPTIYTNAMFGLVPSRNEAFGQVALEFHLMRKTVVASRVGGLPEIVRHMETGLLAENENVAEFAAGMAVLIEDKDLREKLANFGYEQVTTHYTQEVMTTSFVKLMSKA